MGAQKDNDGCIQAVDYKADGLQDLLVCGFKALYLFRHDVSNGRHSFTDVSGELGVGGRWLDAALEDLDGDGDLDLVQSKDKLVRVKLQSDSGAFVKSFETGEVVAASNLAIGDFDGDGARDIYVVGSCYQGSTPFPPDKPDLLLSNQGPGSFAMQWLPAITPGGGCGDDVDRINYDGDQKDEFLVLNGRRREFGPVQLFTYATAVTEPDVTPPDTKWIWQELPLKGRAQPSTFPVKVWYTAT